VDKNKDHILPLEIRQRDLPASFVAAEKAGATSPSFNFSSIAFPIIQNGTLFGAPKRHCRALFLTPACPLNTEY